MPYNKKPASAKLTNRVQVYMNAKVLGMVVEVAERKKWTRADATRYLIELGFKSFIKEID